MPHTLRALILFVALRSAGAQQADFADSCAPADSVLGVATARVLRAPVRQSIWRDGSHHARTGTHMASASGIAVSALWPAASDGGRPTEIQLELTLAADRAQEILAAQDSLVLLLDDRTALALGVPTSARIEGPVAYRLPLFAPLSVGTLLTLARAKSAELRVGSTRARFAARDLQSTVRLARMLVCAGRAT